MSAKSPHELTCVPGASVFEVGGFVRDSLLGVPATDCDWVVVGSTVEAMVEAGFLSVGRDFPVFLHPVTRDEFALARSERKSAPGYRGFVVHADPDVTLEQDLARRDLTINAMARASDGTVIDPFGGRDDLRAGIFRHVSEAFSEDPVRILRLARFAARFPTFTVAPETLDLMRSMVAAGEIDALVPERVWQELSRGLMEAKPSRMIDVLRECGALARLLPEYENLSGVPQSAQHHPEVNTIIHCNAVLDMSAKLGGSLPVRYACLVHDFGKGTTPASVLPRHLGHEARSVELARGVAERLRVPKECEELGEVVAREHGNLHRSSGLNAAATTRLLDRCDAFRKPERFAEVLLACECDSRGRWTFEERPYEPRVRLAACLEAALRVNTAEVAALAMARGQQGPQIGVAIHAARRHAIAVFCAAGVDDEDAAEVAATAAAAPPTELKTSARSRP